MKKTIVLVCALFATISFAEELSLSTYLKGLMKYDVEYQKVQLSTAIQQAQLDSARGMYGWNLSGQLSGSHFDSQTMGASQIRNLNATAVDLTVAKLFENFGTFFSANYAYDQSEMQYHANSWVKSKSYKPAITFTLSQPLWQNWLGKLSDYPIKSLEILKKITLLSQTDELENYFEKKVGQYFDWVLATLSLQLTAENYQNILKLHNQIVKQHQNDYASYSDLLSSRVQVAKMKDILNMQLINWNESTKGLSQEINRAFKPAETWEELPLLPVDYDLPEDLGTTPDYRIAHLFALRFAAMGLEREHVAEQGKIKLDGFLNYSLYESDTNATGLIGELNKTDYILGLKGKVNLEQKDIQGKLRANELQLQELADEWTVISRNLRLGEDRLAAMLMQNRISITEYEQIVAMAKERYSLETQRYNRGKIPLFTLLDAQNNLLSVQNKLLSNQATGYNLDIKYLSIRDQLLPYLKKYFDIVVKN